jgi:hypothetical protein
VLEDMCPQIWKSGGIVLWKNLVNMSQELSKGREPELILVVDHSGCVERNPELC